MPPSNVKLIVLEQANTGNMGYNMHKLYCMASGRHISEIGSDDFYLPGALDILVQTMDSLPKEVGFIYSGYLAMKVIDGIDKIDQVALTPHPQNNYYLWSNHPERRLMQNNFVTPPCLLRAEIYNNLVKYDDKQILCEDYLFKLELSRITRFHKLDGPLSVVRVRSTSISNNPNAKKDMKPWEDRARDKVRQKYGM
jgi:glycosyltransferase involved in cell wall biosynthesis